MIQEVADIAARARAAKLPMRQVIIRAKVDYSTWMRWKHEDRSPNIASLNRVRDALESLLKERSA